MKRGQPVRWSVWGILVGGQVEAGPRATKAAVRAVTSALALALSACGSPSYTVVDASYGQLAPSAALPEAVGPADLVDTLAAARAAWADAGLTEQAYVPSITYHPSDDMALPCGYAPERNPWGCWRPSDGRILIAEHMASHPMLLEVVAHELGHALRGRGGHLPCQAGAGYALMCEHGYHSPEPTERDVLFVQAAL